MDQKEFYKYYLPALAKALESDNNVSDFYIKGPEAFIEASEHKLREIEICLDTASGSNEFLDSVAYYFDAKSHGFNEIDGEKLCAYKERIKVKMLSIKSEYRIK
ncbi:hypothetical protein ED312_23120 [Sinomicrobium pectinilyticum]|uniref:Uncharacterized protein n=1 Tax=Sinomicrobium pectinilyticum TaxID=1084421 RepID=A0A3N0CYX8_SINP1|nr:hypothetical protein [Sinomicrobium pectinilyticum]RNL68612.1 hypothetical protein ED312_23120 [Sinomicrobium pectinilyticum]